MIRILLVEDDPVLARGLTISLETEGYEIQWANSLAQARALNDSQKFDFVLLDLGLPDGSGFQFLDHLRNSGSRLPVMILTAQADEDSVVEGLQRGANDYLKKPFGQREMLARIKAILREPSIRDEKIRLGNLILLLDQRRVLFGETNIELNRREFDILHYLLERAGKIVSRNQLLDFLDKEAEVLDRTIDSHVSHLRGRLRASGVATIKIQSVYGLGYRLEEV